MKRKHPIDDLFRDKLASRELPADDRLFAAIQDRMRIRQQAKRRRRETLLLAAMLALLLVSGLTYYHAPRLPARSDLPVPARAHVNDLTEIPPSKAMVFAAAQPLPGIVPAPVPTPHRSVPHGLRIRSAAPASPPPVKARPADRLAGKLPEVPAGRKGPPAMPLRLPSLECPPIVSPSAWQWSVGASTGPAIAWRRFQPRQTGYDDVLRARERTESPSLALTGRLWVQARSPHGITLQTGLNFTRLKERFSMPGEENGRMTITTQYGPTGEIIRIDTLMEEGPSFQSSNIYRSLDLPLMLGFEYQRGRWSVGLAAGPALNLWFKPEATLLLDNDQDPAFVEGDEAGIFQSTLGLSWLGGADFGYRMQGGWSVQLAAHFHHYPQSFTGESYPLQQHYQTGSLSIGLRKRL